MLEKLFKLKQNNTCIKTEFMAGFVTFCTMVYILIVNSNMYTNPLGTGENILNLSYGVIYVATAISAAIGCFLMGFIANLPLGLACGMGTNAFFIYTVCISNGFSYRNALATIFVEGLVFLVLVLTGSITKLYEAVPDCIRHAIPAGIGLFLVLLGLKSAGIVVPDNTVGLALNSFNLLKISFADMMPACVALTSLFIISVLVKKNVKGAMLWGILSGVVLYYTFGLLISDFYTTICLSRLNLFETCKEYITAIFGSIFISGFDFSEYIAKNGIANFVLTFVTTTISFCLINIFDNIGSLQATCTHENEIRNFDKAMLANSLAATTGAVIGVSTVTTYVESSTGIAEGGKTGLTAIVTGVLFAGMILLSPLCTLVPGCATAPALIYVGNLMMKSVRNIDWSNAEYSIPAFFTMCMMPFTCNISNGIAFGLISYVLIHFFEGKYKDIKCITWLITILFVATILLSH